MIGQKCLYGTLTSTWRLLWSRSSSGRKVVRTFFARDLHISYFIWGISIFRLGLANGKDVIVRIPFRYAGPRNLLTISEVATMDFVRSRLGVLVPII